MRPKPGSLTAGWRRSRPVTRPRKLSSTPSTQPSLIPTTPNNDASIPVRLSRPGSRRDRDADSDIGLAHHVAGRNHVAQIAAEAEHEARERRVLDHIAGDGGVGLDRNADAGGVRRIGAGGTLRLEVTDNVALHGGKAAAVVEIGDRDADGGAVDAIAGDERTLEGKLGI